MEEDLAVSGRTRQLRGDLTPDHEAVLGAPCPEAGQGGGQGPLVGHDSALADQSANGAVHSSKQVCPPPAEGFAACDAYVRTKGGNVPPDATTSYTSGYSPAQLTTAYGLTGKDAVVQTIATQPWQPRFPKAGVKSLRLSDGNLKRFPIPRTAAPSNAPNWIGAGLNTTRTV